MVSNALLLSAFFFFSSISCFLLFMFDFFFEVLGRGDGEELHEGVEVVDSGGTDELGIMTLLLFSSIVVLYVTVEY